LKGRGSAATIREGGPQFLLVFVGAIKRHQGKRKKGKVDNETGRGKSKKMRVFEVAWSRQAVTSGLSKLGKKKENTRRGRKNQQGKKGKRSGKNEGGGENLKRGL